MVPFKDISFFIKCLVLVLCWQGTSAFSQIGGDDLILEDAGDLESLMEAIPSETALPSGAKLDDEFISADEVDDLESLKEDIGSVSFDLDAEIKRREKVEAKKDQQKALKKSKVVKKVKAPKVKTKTAKKATPTKIEVEKDVPHIFNVGKEERELLTIAETIGSKIPDNEWNETVTNAQISTYTVLRGDWLFKISKRLFGSGFYYPKIWSLNPFITNPHEIEPGMILTFSTGTSMDPPEIRLGKFSDQDYANTVETYGSLDALPEDQKPEWLAKKNELRKSGAYFQYSNGVTVEDLDKLNQQKVSSKEYLDYQPPESDVYLKIPDSEYDKVGFDRHAKVDFKFKEGLTVNSFISTNIIQDLGKVHASVKEAAIQTSYDQVFIKFNDTLNVIPGDKFSIYVAEGEVSHKNSDRKGYRYTIRGHVKVLEAKSKEENIYVCQIMDATGVIGREDRITVFSPKLQRIITTFNTQSIDAIIVSSLFPGRRIISYGDVVYIDRGRADGVEVGNVFEVFGFIDRVTKRNITEKPAYKNGELTVITVTDNFATALVTNSRRDFFIGDLAITKSRKSALRADLLSQNKIKAEQLSGDELKKLDAELNLDKLNNNILDKGQQIELTDEELAELERVEREKSILTDGEKDLDALEGLEAEIDEAEKLLRESELDEDKLLEKTNLDIVEKDSEFDKIESVEEIEDEIGKKYLDEDLNDKENPYGLTEFDIEEIDELLNLDQPKGNDVKKAKNTQKLAPQNKPAVKKDKADDLDLDEIDNLLDIEDPTPAQEAKSGADSPSTDEDLSDLF